MQLGRFATAREAAVAFARNYAENREHYEAKRQRKGSPPRTAAAARGRKRSGGGSGGARKQRAIALNEAEGEGEGEEDDGEEDDEDDEEDEGEGEGGGEPEAEAEAAEVEGETEGEDEVVMGPAAAAEAAAAAEGLVLQRSSTSASGYKGVRYREGGGARAYRAELWAGGRHLSLGSFATGQEAALCYARAERRLQENPPPVTPVTPAVPGAGGRAPTPGVTAEERLLRQAAAGGSGLVAVSGAAAAVAVDGAILEEGSSETLARHLFALIELEVRRAIYISPRAPPPPLGPSPLPPPRADRPFPAPRSPRAAPPPQNDSSDESEGTSGSTASVDAGGADAAAARRRIRRLGGSNLVRCRHERRLARGAR